jgi:hypothetical protein
MTTVLWMLFRAARPLLGRNKKYRGFPRALSATVTTLVGAPVAFVTWPVGLIVLLAPVGFWLAQLLTRLRRGLGPPPLWPAALAGVALLLIYVGIRAPLSKTDIVPRAIPAAQLEDAGVELATTSVRCFFSTRERSAIRSTSRTRSRRAASACAGAGSGETIAKTS